MIIFDHGYSKMKGVQIEVDDGKHLGRDMRLELGKRIDIGAAQIA